MHILLRNGTAKRDFCISCDHAEVFQNRVVGHQKLVVAFHAQDDHRGISKWDGFVLRCGKWHGEETDGARTGILSSFVGSQSEMSLPLRASQTVRTAGCCLLHPRCACRLTAERVVKALLEQRLGM
ncbi:hypothetical protein T440DRAFT_473465 [Plenodomus tracheiphilus IPT5]|uniref:Uncharacterized protein n=1 Tax=Plenodomus tracheiphilus IPT5 TaxID=1408161 RepID=A0A6A7AQA0_9PLEO|nr:hypothetical protein T440DRAFT_473465 [Plenodomus tracheiphilus IPT5]